MTKIRVVGWRRGLGAPKRNAPVLTASTTVCDFRCRWARKLQDFLETARIANATGIRLSSPAQALFALPLHADTSQHAYDKSKPLQGSTIRCQRTVYTQARVVGILVYSRTLSDEMQARVRETLLLETHMLTRALMSPHVAAGYVSSRATSPSINACRMAHPRTL